MDSARERSVRAAANDFLMDLWNRRASYWAMPPMNWIQFFPIDLERCVESLGLRLEEPEEIRDDAGPQSSVGAHETAGVLDRNNHRIIIAQKFRPEYKRFTLAHELGHALLHPDVRYHRDRPLTGGERANRVSRSPEEQEADLFGAELLMPACVVTEMFQDIYGRAIGMHEIDEELVYWLKSGTGEPVSLQSLNAGGRERLALLIARNRCYRNRHFPSLCENGHEDSTYRSDARLLVTRRSRTLCSSNQERNHGDVSCTIHR